MKNQVKIARDIISLVVVRVSWMGSKTWRGLRSGGVDREHGIAVLYFRDWFYFSAILGQR